MARIVHGPVPLVAAALVAVVILASATSSGGAADRRRTVRVVSLAPAVTTVDVGRAGRSPGDIAAIESALVDRAGRPAGRMRGTQTAIKVDRGGETVQTSVTFVLGRAGQIVVGGVSQGPLEGVSDAGHRRFIRPVLGGTGAYLGARGQLVTVRRADGRYDQRFELLR